MSEGQPQASTTTKTKSRATAASGTNYGPVVLAFVAVLCSSLYKHYMISPVQDEQQHFVSDGGLHVIDPFTFNTTLLQQLSDLSLWQECNLGTDTKGGAFWMDKEDEPQSIWEDIAAQIWKESPYLSQAAGYEYWCNILDPATPLVWHQDKDEKLAREGKLSHPIMGAVYYGYPHKFKGGELEFVTTFQAEESGEFSADTEFEEVEEVDIEAVEAEYNRLIFINVTHWHRVTPVTKGKRVTFAVNLWKQRPSGVRKASEPKVAEVQGHEVLKEEGDELTNDNPSYDSGVTEHVKEQEAQDEPKGDQPREDLAEPGNKPIDAVQ